MSVNDNNISVLLAEDEPDMLLLMEEYLTSEGFKVHAIGNGLDAYRLFLEMKPNIAVLDIDMPGIDGLKLCAQIRKLDQQTPIIFTSGFSRTDDVKKGFEVGADDYLKKPFDPDELVIRIKHLTKTMQPANQEDQFQLASFQFDSTTHRLFNEQEEFLLSYTENLLLKVLCQSMGQIVSRDDIVAAVWDTKPAIDSRSIDVYISKLRKYLAGDGQIKIINCYGKGYRLIIR